MNGWLKRALIVVVLAVVVLGYGWLIWQGPWLFDGDHVRRADLQPADGVVITGFRTSIVALGAGAVAGVGLLYTHRSVQHTRDMLEHTRVKDREQADLTREGQVTDRYVEAIKLLSSNHLTQRLGGIYSLERIMRDSEKDHPTVVEVLAAFIRTAPEPKYQETPAADARASRDSLESQKPTEDVQAALTVLGRRPSLGEAKVQRVDLRDTNLEGSNLQDADLRCADIRGANLQRADLRGANLQKADLRDANLQRASLDEVDLRNADLQTANLAGASLQNADLQDANLWGTDFRNARLYSANLCRANLREADLEGADLRSADFRNADLYDACLRGVNLIAANLAQAAFHRANFLDIDGVAKALIYRSTRLPSDVASDTTINARIEKCEQALADDDGPEIPVRARGDN
ncbi:pentapeptide repeat-containing protein [Streptomyces sp. NBC_00724]|uniref:pentapeptide repeat-containing protein n=1 Tax=Streptomyces sp. NBC_00724 TaxID=2975812 RepID=UPI002ED4605F|nr:pentapeptide repeat-containing protein [Streptomyces sp. NBC_00724]